MALAVSKKMLSPVAGRGMFLYTEMAAAERERERMPKTS